MSRRMSHRSTFIWSTRGLVAACAVLVVAAAVNAQSTAQIGGTVRDQSGAVLPGTDVTVAQTDTGFMRTTVSDGDGLYIVSDFSGINVDSGWNDPNNPDYDRGPCLSNRRHLFNATVGAEAPQFGNATARALASGWRVSGIIRASSGTPVNVTSGLDRAMTGIVNQRPDQVLDDPYGDGSSLDRYLNPAAFAQPALGTLGNVGAFAFEGPGRWSIDMVLAKVVRFGASQRVELRAEAFNVTNNLMRGNPISNFNDANFGRILAAGDPRILQFGVKYGF